MSQTMSAPPVAERIRSVDILRGLVMILMALDHVRDFWAPGPLPEDMDEPGLALFMTRWVTHFCAPVFIFLAGTSAFLYQRNTGASNRELSRFLFTRGLWLVIIEITIVNLSWGAPFAGFAFLQVIWAIGMSMIVLAVLIHLPIGIITGIGLVMVFAHNLLDGIDASQFDSPVTGAFWAVLHQSHWIPLTEGGYGIWVAYPLVPWIGVMALGFAFGQVLQRPRVERDRTLLFLGSFLVAAWLVLRGFNLYGDPVAWAPVTDNTTQTLISFLNAEKYPPSLIFLLMTLGPALLLMPLIENWRGKLAEAVTVFGRVPFFYYVLHLPLIHGAAIVYSMVRYGTAGWWFLPQEQHPPDYTHNLWLAYGVWIAVVVVLYPVCRWYASLKRRRKDWWLSYL